MQVANCLYLARKWDKDELTMRKQLKLFGDIGHTFQVRPKLNRNWLTRTSDFFSFHNFAIPTNLSSLRYYYSPKAPIWHPITCVEVTNTRKRIIWMCTLECCIRKRPDSCFSWSKCEVSETNLFFSILRNNVFEYQAYIIFRPQIKNWTWKRSTIWRCNIRSWYRKLKWTFWRATSREPFLFT